MFGVYRTILAMLVVMFHLLGVPVLGPAAVFAFFVLSGFLMTMITQENYGFSPRGTGAYLLNRALRLYPMAWMSLAIAAGTVLITGAAYASGYHPHLAMPTTFGAWAANATLVFPRALPYEFAPRLLPATWALTVELTFYVLIGLGLSRTRRMTALWLAASLIYTAATFAWPANVAWRYGTVFAGSLPFAVGAVIYFWREAIARTIPAVLQRPSIIPVTLQVGGVCMLTIVKFLIEREFVNEIALLFVLVTSPIVITHLWRHGLPLISRRQDRAIGDYSYPLYLNHWTAGLLASFMLFPVPTLGASSAGGVSFVLALLIAIGLSAVLIQIVSATDRARDRIRRAARNDTDGAIGDLAVGQAERR